MPITEEQMAAVTEAAATCIAAHMVPAMPPNSGVAIFCWDMDESGKLAYFTNTNVPDMLNGVRAWLARMEKLQ